MLWFCVLLLGHVTRSRAYVQDIFTQTLQQDRAVHHLTNAPVPFTPFGYGTASYGHGGTHQPLLLLMPPAAEQAQGARNPMLADHHDDSHHRPSPHTPHVQPAYGNTHALPSSFMDALHGSHSQHQHQNTITTDSQHITSHHNNVNNAELLSLPIQHNPSVLWNVAKQHTDLAVSPSNEPPTEQDYIDFSVADVSSSDAREAGQYLTDNNPFDSFISETKFNIPKFEKPKAINDWQFPSFGEEFRGGNTMERTPNPAQIQIHPPIAQSGPSSSGYNMLDTRAKLDSVYTMHDNGAPKMTHAHSKTPPVWPGPAAQQPGPSSGHRPHHTPQLNIVHLYPHGHSQQHPPQDHNRPAQSRVNLLSNLLSLLGVHHKQARVDTVGKSASQPVSTYDMANQAASQKAVYAPPHKPILSHPAPQRITPLVKAIVPLPGYAGGLYQPLAAVPTGLSPINIHTLPLLMGQNRRYKHVPAAPRHYDIYGRIVTPLPYRALATRRRMRARSPIARYAKIVGEDVGRGGRALRRRRRGRKRRRQEEDPDDDIDEDSEDFGLEVTDEDDYVVIRGDEESDYNEDYEDNSEYYDYK